MKSLMSMALFTVLVVFVNFVPSVQAQGENKTYLEEAKFAFPDGDLLDTHSCTNHQRSEEEAGEVFYDVDGNGRVALCIPNLKNHTIEHAALVAVGYHAVPEFMNDRAKMPISIFEGEHTLITGRVGSTPRVLINFSSIPTFNTLGQYGVMLYWEDGTRSLIILM